MAYLMITYYTRIATTYDMMIMWHGVADKNGPTNISVRLAVIVL